jgi:hypothetical protein
MADEGTVLLMAELLKEEKRLQEELSRAEAGMEAPMKRLQEAKALVAQAQATQAQAQDALARHQAQKGMIEEKIKENEAKKSQLRVENRVAQGGGLRPGTAEFVEQMQEITGDDTEVALENAQKQADIDAELKAMKAALGVED